MLFWDKHMFRTICILSSSLILAELPSLIGMNKNTTQPAYISEAIGVKTFEYQDAKRNRPVIVEFWYPTDEMNTTQEVQEDSVWVHPKEARNVSFSNRQTTYPLILMSHGHRGDRRERTWLVDSLVRQGFLVASVEHFGSCWHQFNPLSSFCFWDRAQDVSFALDRILEDKELLTKIDTKKIGFVGYSMGGMTGLALAGAEAKNAKEIAAKELSQLGQIPVSVLDAIDFSLAEKSYYEPRIRSMLLICPAAFAYLPEGLRKIKGTIGLIASLDDEVLPHKEHGRKIIQYLMPRKLKIMKNKTSHYAFLNPLTEKGYKILEKAVPSSSVNWTGVHKEATEFAIRFFQETLK